VVTFDHLYLFKSLLVSMWRCVLVLCTVSVSVLVLYRLYAIHFLCVEDLMGCLGHVFVLCSFYELCDGDVCN